MSLPTDGPPRPRSARMPSMTALEGVRRYLQLVAAGEVRLRQRTPYPVPLSAHQGRPGGPAAPPPVVGDVMRPTPTVRAGTSFADVVAALTGEDATALPVTGPRGRLVGILSASDLLAAVATRNPSADRSLPPERRHLPGPADRRLPSAQEMMTVGVLTTRPDAEVSEAAEQLARARIHQLPVVDEQGRVLGLVRRGDLLAALVARTTADTARAMMSGPSAATGPETP